MEPSAQGIDMSDGATASYFYKLGCLAALAKVGESLDRPEDQTYQVHTEVESPAHNGPDGPPKAMVDPSNSTTQGVWNEHDKRIDQGILPTIDSRTGL